jgi:hypothetical protein
LGIDGQGKHNYEYDKVLFHFVIKDMAEQHSFFCASPTEYNPKSPHSL